MIDSTNKPSSTIEHTSFEERVRLATLQMSRWDEYLRKKNDTELAMRIYRSILQQYGLDNEEGKKAVLQKQRDKSLLSLKVSSEIMVLC
jgi:hypothetical protein